jgi:hypothetical protein
VLATVLEKMTLTKRISNRSKTASTSGICNSKTTTLKQSTVSIFPTQTECVKGERNVRAQGKKDEEDPSEQVDKNGRITKGPFTLKNGAVYTG